MKSNISIKLLILCALVTMTFSAKMQKSETVLEFFNNLFTTNEGSESESISNNFMRRRSEDKSRSESGNEVEAVKSEGTSENAVEKAEASTENKSEVENLATRQTQDTTANTQQTTNNTDIDGWLSVSSMEFTNVRKFPPVILNDGKEVYIRITSDYFRINEMYKQGVNDTNSPPNSTDFWFRLKNDNLFYSMNPLDINILGSIKFRDVEMDPDSSRNCINLHDIDATNWRICAADKNVRQKFFCGIKKNLGLKDYECDNEGKNNTAVLDYNLLPAPTVITDKLIQPIFLIPLASKKCNAGWNYANNGKDWECDCKDGQGQSPIDLPAPNAAVQSPVTPLFKYEEVPAMSTITTLDGGIKEKEYIKIKYHNGALRIFHPNMGKIVTLDGAVYIAEEIVFHTPAEHTIEGRRHEMEMQIIHYGVSKGDISKQVVLSFLFEKKSGIYNKFIDDVDFFNLPNPTFLEREITNNLFIPKVFYTSTSEDIPVMQPFSFYTYEGSLTFPPCTERTIHYVASKTIKIGSSPLELMKEALKSPDLVDPVTKNVYRSSGETTENFRDTQPLNDRTVFYFDSDKYCGQSSPAPLEGAVPSKGHFEKVQSQDYVYLFVSGNAPSGLPDTFVVSEKEAKGRTINEAEDQATKDPNLDAALRNPINTAFR